MNDVLVVILAGLAVLVGMVLFRRRGPEEDRAVPGGRPYAGSGLPGQPGRPGQPGHSPETGQDVRSAASGQPARTGTARILNQPVDPMVVAVVVALLGQNKKVKAVKELRDSTRLGLADAKALVEAIAAGHRPPTVVLRGDAVDVTPHTPPPGPYGSAESPEAAESRGPSPADLAERARSLRSQGREIEAIRLVRTETGMGLADAQRFVRALG